MKPNFVFFSLLTLAFLLLACKPKTAETKEETRTASNAPVNIEAQFVCADLTEDESMPRAALTLKLNGKMHVLDTIAVCESIEPSDYARYDIPAEAVAAAGGWWAGAGDYFYARVEGNVCIVMQGWQDEQQEDEGFHYEQVRRLVVSEK
jgi:hypothetical protein